MNKNRIVSALIAGKKSIFNCRIKNNRRVFQLGGVGAQNLKVRPNRIKEYPNLELIGFLPWDKWDSFTTEEKNLVMAFYDQLPK